MLSEPLSLPGSGFFYVSACCQQRCALRHSNHWGWPFRGRWELAEQQLPSPAQVLGCLAETRGRICAHMAALTDADLTAPYDHAETRLERCIYAIRHTMHHHGALSLLALQRGKPAGHWE